MQSIEEFDGNQSVVTLLTRLSSDHDIVWWFTKTRICDVKEKMEKAMGNKVAPTHPISLVKQAYGI